MRKYPPVEPRSAVACFLQIHGGGAEVEDYDVDLAFSEIGDPEAEFPI